MATKTLEREKERDLVQLQNPRSGLYVKIDRSVGQIVSQKESPGPYEGIRIVARRRKKSSTRRGFKAGLKRS
jgi:hypothetical protein